MSIFKNNTSYMNEGEQAEAYKARKAKEAEDKKKEEEKRDWKRYGDTQPGARYTGDHYRLSDNSDLKRLEKANSVYKKELEGRAHGDNQENYENMKHNLNSKNGFNKSTDAIDRHIRRHPDQYKECGIFESVSFLNKIVE